MISEYPIVDQMLHATNLASSTKRITILRARLSPTTPALADLLRPPNLHTAKIMLGLIHVYLNQLSMFLYSYVPFYSGMKERKASDNVFPWNEPTSNSTLSLRKHRERQRRETVIFLSPLWYAVKIVYALCKCNAA